MNISMKKIAARALLVSAGALFCLQNAWALLPIQHWTDASGARVWLVHSPAIPMVDVQVDFDRAHFTKGFSWPDGKFRLRRPPSTGGASVFVMGTCI